MKYYEVFKDGMPMWLYQLSEKERLKFEFDIDSNHNVWLKPQSIMNKIMVFIGLK